MEDTNAMTERRKATVPSPFTFAARRAVKFCWLLLVLLVGGGCGPRQVERDFNKWADGIKQSHKSADLKAAAISVILTVANTSGAELPSSALPPVLAALEQGQPSWIQVIADGKPEDKTLEIGWGGGFGHWGVAITPFGGRPPTKPASGKCVPWENGVHFWYGL